ncbi:uncharacterized protein [Erythrolamprus reginae]|uniref:uncharacterized protein n=1 Tax=Erythrolamprus reginae TaxID=121349 RepID=UPI00396C8524
MQLLAWLTFLLSGLLVTHALDTSRPDYCNVLYMGLPLKNVRRFCPPGAGVTGWPQGGRRNLPSERGCCKRQRRLVFLGHDLSGSPVSVDVGLCRSLSARGQSTPSGLPRKLSPLDSHRTLKEGPGGDPHPQGRCCPPGSRCQPSRLLVQDRWLREGPRPVEVVDRCQCQASPQECVRSPALKTFFPDSPLEQTLDVGSCAGAPPTRGGPFCRPMGFHSVLLQGPNGKRLVRTLEGCRAQGTPCHRLPRWEHYSEVVLDAGGRRREQRKEMDLGRCSGRCQREPVGTRAAAHHCIPDSYETKTFQSRTGELRTLFVIRTCKCGPKPSGASMLPHV